MKRTKVKIDWTQSKNKFRTKSDKLTKADLEQIGGKRTELVSYLESRLSVTKTALARVLFSAFVLAIVAGCDGRGGLTRKADSRVVSGDVTTSVGPGQLGPGQLGPGAGKAPERPDPKGNPPPVPEPRVLLLVGVGLVGLAMLRRRQALERLVD